MSIAVSSERKCFFNFSLNRSNLNVFSAYLGQKLLTLSLLGYFNSFLLFSYIQSNFNASFFLTRILYFHCDPLDPSQ